jgi:cation:H+ antiporter
MLPEVLQYIRGLPAVLPLAVGVVLLLLGGSWLVDGAVGMARRLRLSPLLIGLTVVAFGTSAPELFFNLAAALGNHPELSFGNVVGSNIANIALVIGLAAMMRPLAVHSRVLKKELPLLIGVSAAMLLLAWLGPAVKDDGTLRSGWGRTDGLIMLAGFMGVTWLWYRMGRRDRRDPLLAEAEAEARLERPLALGVAVALGLLALIAGGKLAELGAAGVASWLGMSQAFIGLTVVAIATSLPEVVTSLMACRKGHADLAVGNVVGSNLFNILLVLGATATVAPVPVPVKPSLLGIERGWGDLLVMLGLTVILLPMAATSRQHIRRWEGAFLLLCYLAYLGLSVVRELS